SHPVRLPALLLRTPPLWAGASRSGPFFMPQAPARASARLAVLRAERSGRSDSPFALRKNGEDRSGQAALHEIRAAFADHDARCIGIAANEARHDRGVGDPKAVEPARLER